MLAAVLGFAACSSTRSYEILSFFFDGVPDPRHRQKPQVPADVPKRVPLTATAKPGPGMFSHRPFAENKCAKCHSSRGEKPDDISAIFQGVPVLLEPLNRLCFKCHQIERKKYLHAPAVSGQCIFCHDPHQTPNRKMLLTKKTPELCARCHRGSTFLTRTAHAKYGDRECTECHDPHAADFEFNLLPGVSERKPEPRKPTVSLPEKW